MTETPAPMTPWRPCFANPLLNLAVYLAVLVGAAAYAVGGDAHFVYVTLFIVSSIWYGASCDWLAADGAAGIDAHVASDAIITCGIASLILHVAIAGSYVDAELARSKGFSETIVRQVARVFAEGLACAAAAPVIAMVLRFVEARKSRIAEAETPADTGQALGEFTQRAAGMARTMIALSDAIDDSAEGYQGAASRVAISLEALATAVQQRSKAITEQLAELEERLRALNESVAQSSNEFAEVGNRIDDFSGKLRADSALLDGLRDLIGSVERFIRPNTDTDLGSGKS
jgi:methyl-accepting chemotaxis protein